MNAMLLPFPDHAHGVSAADHARELIRSTLDAGHTHHANNPWFIAYVHLLTHMHEHIDVRDIIATLPYSASLDEEGFQKALSRHNLLLEPTSRDNAKPPYIHYDTAGRIDYIVTHQEDGNLQALDCLRAETVTLDPDAMPRGRFFQVAHKTAEEKQAEKQVEQSAGHGWFRTMLQRFHGQFAKLLGVSILLNLFSLIAPLLVMVTYDRVVAAQARDDLHYLAAGFLTAIVVETSLRLIRARHIAWLGTRIDVICTHSIIRHLLRLPAAMVERASVASQIARIKSLSEIREFFTGPLFLTCIELPFTLLLLAALALLGGSLALIPIVAALSYMAVFWMLHSYTRRTMFRAARSHSQLEQATLETFHHMEALRVGAMQYSWRDHVTRLSAQSSRATFHAAFLSALLENLAYATTALAGLMTLFLGVQHVLAGSLTAGGLIASMIFVWRILAPISSLCTMLPRIEQMRQTIAQINKLMELKCERDREPSDKACLKIQGRISLSSVGIRYSRDADPVFAGLNLQVAKGQTVAIMGGNGCGKSTLLKLVLGLYQPQAGTIQIDGTDIRQLRTSDLRRTCAYIAQSPDFYSGTIAENLRIACPEATDTAILQALHEVGLGQTIASLPNGIHTWLDCSDSEGTPTLLTYRINLARACLSKAPIVLCDELPYALLQGETGNEFTRILQQWRGRRSVLFVTHREDLAADADLVIGLRHGKPPLVGTPQTVLPMMKEESHAAPSTRAS